MNRTIMEKARCMILHSKLKKPFWSKAILNAIYVINRSPTTALTNKVPAELWFGKRPCVRKIKVFGCLAYLHIPKELKPGKLNSHSKKCIMIGYTNTDIVYGARKINDNLWKRHNLRRNEIYNGYPMTRH